jgi:hypothetical protein
MPAKVLVWGWFDLVKIGEVDQFPKDDRVKKREADIDCRKQKYQDHKPFVRFKIVK